MGVGDNGIKFVDLFCGMGSFHVSMLQQDARSTVVCACDTDTIVRNVYRQNFGVMPEGDIRDIQKLPDHDILCAGFPCQSFSKIGKMRGFEDEGRGDLFFEVARLLRESRPPFVVLENVKKLITHDRGASLQSILDTLREIGYHVEYKSLNALEYGLPQLRERVFIVAFLNSSEFERFKWPEPYPSRLSLEDVLEPLDAGPRYRASERVVVKTRSRAGDAADAYPDRRTIWYTSKSGTTSVRDYSRCLRSQPSYNYLLVDGVRRPTELEMLRLQGFSDDYDLSLASSYTAKRQLLGNTIPVNLSSAVLRSVIGARLHP